MPSEIVWESGRFIVSRRDGAAARFAAANLLTTHGRLGRLRAAVRGPAIDWRPVALAEAVPPEVSTLLRDSGTAIEWLAVRDYSASSRGRGLFFGFGSHEDQPSEAVKWRAMNATGNPLEHEASVLSEIHARGGDVLAGTVPRLRRYDTSDGYEWLAVSVLPGIPMGISMPRSLRPLVAHGPVLIAAGAWLGSMQRATSEVPGRCIVHGDLWPRNVLMRKSHVTGVVDWEQGMLDGAGWQDLFDLALLFSVGLPRWRQVDPVAAFRVGFIDDTPLSATIARYLAAWTVARAPHQFDLREMFERYLDAREAEAGEEKAGWKKNVPWSAIRGTYRSASRSVFSG